MNTNGSKKSRSPTKQLMLASTAINHLDFAHIVGWLTDCSMASMAGKDLPPTPTGFDWLLTLRSRADAVCDVADARSGVLSDDIEQRQVSELWRLTECLILLGKRFTDQARGHLEAANNTRPGRKKTASAPINALAIRGLLDWPTSTEKPKGRPGRKRLIDIEDDDLLMMLEVTKDGRSEKSRLTEIVKLTGDARRKTGRGHEQIVRYLQRGAAEARAAKRSEIEINARHFESANPNERRGILDATASHPHQEDTCRDFPPLT